MAWIFRRHTLLLLRDIQAETMPVFSFPEGVSCRTELYPSEDPLGKILPFIPYFAGFYAILVIGKSKDVGFILQDIE